MAVGAQEVCIHLFGFERGQRAAGVRVAVALRFRDGHRRVARSGARGCTVLGAGVFLVAGSPKQRHETPECGALTTPRVRDADRTCSHDRWVGTRKALISRHGQSDTKIRDTNYNSNNLLYPRPRDSRVKISIPNIIFIILTILTWAGIHGNLMDKDIELSQSRILMLEFPPSVIFSFSTIYYLFPTLAKVVTGTVPGYVTIGPFFAIMQFVGAVIFTVASVSWLSLLSDEQKEIQNEINTVKSRIDKLEKADLPTTAKTDTETGDGPGDLESGQDDQQQNDSSSAG